MHPDSKAGSCFRQSRTGSSLFRQRAVEGLLAHLGQETARQACRRRAHARSTRRSGPLRRSPLETAGAGRALDPWRQPPLLAFPPQAPPTSAQEAIPNPGHRRAPALPTGQRDQGQTEDASIRRTVASSDLQVLGRLAVVSDAASGTIFDCRMMRSRVISGTL